MIKETVTVDEVIDLLNGIIQTDIEAAACLFPLTPRGGMRVHCNKELGEHPTIQTGLHDGECTISPLGILNGLFGIRDSDGYGAITLSIDDDEKAQFIRTDKWKGADKGSKE